MNVYSEDNSTARHGTARHGTARHGTARHGTARHGTARRVSILICTYNRADTLKVALESLSKLDADKSLYEIVVINNNSTDNTNTVCQDFAVAHSDITFRCVFEPRPGTWRARNRAVAEAHYELLAMMDDDQTVLPSYVDAIIKTFEDYPEYTAIGGRMFPFGEDGREIKCTSRYLNPFCKSDLGDVAKEYPKKVSLSNPTMYFPSGGAITIKKEFFEQYGDYGEPYFECSLTEDIYISSKLRQNNKKILYAPAVVIYHHIPKERYEYNYLMKSGYGGGVAQARQARSSLINRMLKFLFATGVGVFYFVTFRPTKGRYLIGFQYHWLKGYIKGMAQAK